MVGEGGYPETSYTFHEDTNSSAVSSVSDKKRFNSQDKLDSSSCTAYIFNNGILLPHIPCTEPWWFDRDGKKPSVKVD